MMSSAVSEPIQFQHSSHEHGLVFQDFGGDCNINCSICKKSVGGSPAYYCADCGFFIHKLCAELPDEIKHPFHPEHPLELRRSMVQVLDKPCNACNKFDWDEDGEYHFGCLNCQVFFHLQCVAATLPAATSDPENEPESEIQEFIIRYFSHEHPLVPIQLHMPCGIECKACGQQIFGRVYGCLVCKFVLHESCALAPKNVTNHPLHPQHPLTLVVDLQGRKVRCGVCDSRLGQFAYKCDECYFFLNLKCAVFITSHPRDDENCEKDISVIPRFFHPHPLTHLQVPAEISFDFICELCFQTITDDDFFYCLDRGCRGTRFAAHKSCSDLPREVIHPLHVDHPLTFVNDIDCALCGSSSYVGFRCQECLYDLDVECSLEKSKVEQVIHIQHIHEHPLRLWRSIAPGVTVACHVCWESAAVGLVYSCEKFDCGVVIHRACAEVACESEHSIHPPHPLILLPQPSYKSIPCSACLDDSCSGFTFYCDYCKIQFHPRCVMKKPALKHQRHEHSLTYFGHMNGKTVQCNVCCLDCKVDFYRCVPCNYNLHHGCLFLPPSIKHEWHIHPMELRDRYINDTFDDQYCDLCETLRNPEHGVYHCVQCRCATHIDCVIPRASLEERRIMEDLELTKLDGQIFQKETELEAMRKKMEMTEKDLEALKAKKQEILNSRMQ